MFEMSRQEIDQMLADGRIGRLSMAGADGRPYAIPLPFCWSAGELYLRLALTGRRGQVLRENDRVCFEVDYCSDTLDDYASVLIEGRLREVTDLIEKATVKRFNTAKYERLRRGFRPGHGRTTPLEDLPLRKIVVEQLSGRARQPSTSVPAFAIAERT